MCFHPIRHLALLACALAATFCAQAAETTPAAAPKHKDPAYVEITDDPTLPCVLTIGDSVSVGYTLVLRKEFVG